MKRLPLLFFLTLALVGCSRSVIQHIGDRAFLVPKKQLFADQLYWMPFKSNGFSFILNPERELPEQIAVELYSIRDACPRGFTNGDNQGAFLCRKKSLIVSSQTPLPSYDLQKQMGDMGNAVWSYRLHSADGGHPIVSCSATSPGDAKGGLCSAMAAYKDLIFSIHVREVNVPRLPILVASVQATLSKWEADAAKVP
jgi:hypothetical protein